MSNFYEENSYSNNKVESYNGNVYSDSQQENQFSYLQTVLLESIDITLDTNTNSYHRIFLEISSDGENWGQIIPKTHIINPNDYTSSSSLLTWETSQTSNWNTSHESYDQNKIFAAIHYSNQTKTLHFSLPVYLRFKSIFTWTLYKITDELVLNNIVLPNFNSLIISEQQLVDKYNKTNYYTQDISTRGLISLPYGNVIEKNYYNVVSLQVGKISYAVPDAINTYARLYIIKIDNDGNELDDSKFDPVSFTITRKGQTINSSNTEFTNYIAGATKIPDTQEPHSELTTNSLNTSRPYAWINSTTDNTNNYTISFSNVLNLKLKLTSNPVFTPSSDEQMIIDIIPNINSNLEEDYTQVKNLLAPNGNPFSLYENGLTSEMSYLERRIWIVRYLLNDLISQTRVLKNIPIDFLGLNQDQLNLYDDSITSLSLVKADNQEVVVDDDNIKSFYAIFENENDVVKIVSNNEFIRIKRITDNESIEQYSVITAVDNVETQDPNVYKAGDIILWKDKKILFGSLTVTTNTQGSSSGDPYVNTLSGNKYKLPNKQQIYRLFHSIKESNNIIINASVSQLKETEVNNLINIAKNYTFQTPVVDGYFYDKFYISYANKYIIFDRNIELQETNIDQLLIDDDILVIYNNNKEEFICDIQGRSFYTSVIIKIYNVEIKLMKIYHPQIINGIEIKYSGNKNNVTGIINSELHPKNYKVKKLDSKYTIREKKHKLYNVNKQETWISVT